ncbi:MAG: site-2 protease family protein [Actinomycetota bacterium]|nr:site-2 protease family protein [Actinomycetota bacterium]
MTRSSSPVAPPGGGADVKGLLRMALVLGLVVAVFVFFGLTPLLIVIVAIILIVMLHELGHFVTAKLSGMKVTEYFVGFGPRLWSVRLGETDYGIKPILLGGYVKIPGMTNLEEVDVGDEPRTYRRQPFRNRILVASAGSIMHFVMAFLLAYGALLYFGAPTSDVKTVIAGFATWPGHAETVAQQAGLRPGDVVLAADGRAMDRPTALVGVIESSAGRPVTLAVERDGKRRDVTVTPQAGHRVGTSGEALGPGKTPSDTVGIVGITVDQSTVFSSEGPVRAVGTSVIDVGRDVAATARAVPEGVGSLYRDILSPKAAAQSARTGTRAESIFGAVRTATQAEESGVLYLIEVLIALNIAFGILNMLPMLPLDGGHVAIAVYERIRTRRGQPYYQADAAKLMPVVYAFSAVLLVIVVSALYLDIAHPIANPFH